jgi:hypothetical protein
MLYYELYQMINFNIISTDEEYKPEFGLSGY